MLVSILIPCYNVEKYLNLCLDSVINQTYKDLQIVIVDDGSTDNTLAIAQSYADKDSRIELYHQENKGVAAARNELLKHIKGEYFLFVDSDDWLEPDTLEFLVNQIIQNNADICGYQKVVVDANVRKDFIYEIWTKEKTICEFLKHQRLSGSFCNKLIKSDLVRGEEFQNDISYGEDALLFWRILQKAESFLYTNKEGYHYRMNDASISHSRWTPEGKGSCHSVWKIIVSECKGKWPHYLPIAKARFALEDMWGIYFAAQSNYPFDEHIKLRQDNIKRNILVILRANFASSRMKIFALLSCHNYKLCKLLLAR